MIKEMPFVKNHSPRHLRVCNDLHWLLCFFFLQCNSFFIYHIGFDSEKYNDSRRTLRSSNNRLLDEPRANLKACGERAFSVAVPSLWNKLSLQIRLSSSEAVFKAYLKTYLFKRAFDL